MGLKDWLEERRTKRMYDRYKKGYDVAAGCLLRGEVDPCDVDGWVQESKDFDTFDAFDEGAQAAADHWRARERMLT
jgi:hypothetical protein